MTNDFQITNDDDIEQASRQYEAAMDDEFKKRTGSFYTDSSIIRYMLKLVLCTHDVVENPYIKILDPCCGCGYFLVEAYDMLYEIYLNNMDNINKLHPKLKLDIDKIHEHILKYNIFGEDIDGKAVRMAAEALMHKKPESAVLPGIICCDSLLDLQNTSTEGNGFCSQGFDIIIGNPPYIGHKKLKKDYRKALSEIYGDIFKDKADISFCFIKYSLVRLNKKGKLCFITSRYFIESMNGRALRQYIKNNASIRMIIDFYGVRIMKGISVDPAIIFLQKCGEINSNEIKVLKAKPVLKKLKGDDIFKEIKNDKYFENYNVPQKSLKDKGWSLCKPDVSSIIDKIEKACRYSLADICESFQGIITGCDKAFVINEEELERYEIENDLIKPWIKSSSIEKYKVRKSSLYIIYSDFIEQEYNYKNAISHIGKYREKLEHRRECQNGVREWYELQWGRKSALFEKQKIVFPYKASEGRFALDSGSYCSADVYGMYIKKEAKNMSYEFLLGLLNSRLYEFYFKSFAKKLGDKLYEYYPNTVMRLMIPLQDEFIRETVREMMDNDMHNAEKHMDEIEGRLYQIFGLNDDEINIVERGE